MAELESIRINKVLKEFNIGMGTLVDFLKSKGIEAESNPNFKISGSAYELVAKEFKKEITIKEESKKIALKVKDFAKNEMKQSATKAEPKPEPKFEIKAETKVETKPDIKPEIKAGSKAAIKPEIKAEPAVEPAAVPVVEPAAMTKAEPEVEVKIESKPEIKAQTKPSVTPAPAEVETVKAVPVPAPKEVEQISIQPKAETAAKQEEVFRTSISELHAPKNLGTIDLNRKKVQAAPAVDSAAPKTSTQKPAETAPVIEHIETKVERLTGPNIKGTIDLSQFEKKKENKQKNGKRERIHKQKEKVDVAHEAGKNPTSANFGKGQGQKNGQFHQNQQNQQGSLKHNRKDKFKPIKNEIDDDEVQKQIKETYQRMVESKGKTKGSKYRREKRELMSQRQMEEEEMEQMQSKILKLTEFVTVNDLSVMMNVPVTQVIGACMNLGLMVSINQRLDAEALVLVAEEFGYTVEFVTADIQEAINEENDVDRPEDMVSRPPIVTVMGHVDHGKTSLLDYVRKSNVIAGEAGGITQHIGAYNVKLPSGRRITFLDTPGHEAFTAMRARGAKITDVAIIIIAADDAIMPQTVEAINHAQAAGVPMIFAINKIDKPGANPEKIREQLSNMNILVEDWGGKYQCQEISAKKGIGVEDLLEKVLLEADMLELKANPSKKAVGSVIESALDKGRGYVATILVQSGTLHVGDIMLSGCYTGRVKAMFNERGQKVSEAGPSTPVSILGLNGAPTAGENFNIFEDEKEARDIANKREQLIRIQGLKTQKHITLEEIGRRIAIGNFKELNFIIKGDVDGSIEALSDSIIKLSTEEVRVNVIHKAVGAISESDVLLAAASNAIIIGFQVRPAAQARKLADKEEIEIRLYSVIYDAINEIKSGIEGMLAPEEKEEITATAEVKETFKISKVGTIAGCVVKEGKLSRSAKVRVIRDGIVVYTGVLGSLKRFKDDAKEVISGQDCGLNIENYNDIKIGDVVEAYQIVEVKRTL